MKDVGTVRQKLKQAAYRHLKKRLESELREEPDNCAFNERVPPTVFVGRTGSGPCHGVGMCRHPWPNGGWPGVCDAAASDRSKGCPHFQARKSKDEIKKEFQEFLATAQLYEIAADGMQDVASLLWVLGDEAPGREVSVGEDIRSVKVFGVTIPVMDSSQEAALVRIMELLEEKDQKALEALDAAQESIETLQEDYEARKRDHEHVSQENTKLREEVTKLREEVTKLREEVTSAKQLNYSLIHPKKPWWQRVWGGWS
jgi:hypothetical protein